MKRRLALAATALAVAGCAGPQPDRYAGERPALDVRRDEEDFVFSDRIRVGEVTLSFPKP